MIVSKIRIATFAMLLQFVCAPLNAQEHPDPAEVVRQVTSGVLAVVQDYRDRYDENPEMYFSAIDGVVADHINFERMAFLVMDAKYYRASTDEQKAVFVEAFRQSLVRTYSKGLLSVDRAEFEIEPVDAAPGAQTVNVMQSLRAGANEFDLSYSMRREPDGRWLLVNVVIDGINLGSTFRNQFAQSAIKYNEDLDLVIQNWANDN